MMAVHAHAHVHLDNQVTWNTSSYGKTDELVNLTTHDNAGGLVFIRPSGDVEHSKQSGTNIAINNRYLSNLQDGHYVFGVACAGDVQISAVSTSKKNQRFIRPIHPHPSEPKTDTIFCGTSWQ